MIYQIIGVERPAGALVLTQECGTNGDLADIATVSGFPGFPFDTGVVPAADDPARGAPSTDPGEGDNDDPLFGSYPAAGTYPVWCDLNLGTAQLVLDGPLSGQYYAAQGVLNQVSVLDTSVAIGTNGNPIISYHDNTNGDLKVAACGNLPCTAASLATVDSVGDVGWYTSVAIGTNGNPIISYYDNTNGDLKVAACTNPTCTSPATITTLDSTGNVGIDTSIAVGTDGNPVISYYLGVSGDLKVAACTNPACTAATVSTVDSAGDVGADNSIAIGTDGNPVISYYDTTGDDLKVAACSDPACSTPATITTVDAAGNTGIDTSIAIGTDGNPVISYWDSTTLRLRVAACATPTCSTATLTTVDADNNGGLYTSIAIGADGNPVVAYFDLARSNLRLARCLVADCTVAAVDEIDTPGSVGVFTSTAVAGDGTIVISYRTTSFLDLKLATVAL